MSTLALCIPAYNAEAYLPRLLQSAKDQIIPFDEILVYNDCSTDATEHVALKYGAKVTTGDVNRGCSYGKNTLAKATNCDWLHFHDADDDLLPDFTTRVHQWITASGNEYDILILNYEYVDFASGQSLGTANHNAAELHRDALKYAISNKIVNFGVYKRSAFLKAGGFDLDERVLFNEDNAFHQSMAKHGLQFDYLPEITCINYRYKISMSASNGIKCARSNYYVLAKTASGYGDTYPLELSRQLWVCATMLASFQDWGYVKKALKLTRDLGYSSPQATSGLFKVLTFINPYFGFWIREKLIRLTKPHLRREI